MLGVAISPHSNLSMPSDNQILIKKLMQFVFQAQLLSL